MKKKRARSRPVPGRTAPAPATGGRVQVGEFEKGVRESFMGVAK